MSDKEIIVALGDRCVQLSECLSRTAERRDVRGLYRTMTPERIRAWKEIEKMSDDVCEPQGVGACNMNGVCEKHSKQAAKGHPAFHALLKEIGRLHDRKQADYGISADPFANIRASQDFGVPPWVGSILRGNDKMYRIKSFILNGNLKNESVEDSLLDLAVYSLISLVLLREQNDERRAKEQTHGADRQEGRPQRRPGEGEEAVAPQA